MNGDILSPLETLRYIVSALQNPACFDHPVSRFETIETHISLVLLTGSFAYKFKKPVNLGFVDFTTLAKRRHYCEEELRLNRRLAPELYLDVIAVGGDMQEPRFHVDPAFEYCVKMRQFPRSAELEQVMRAGAIDREDFVRLAQSVARFHAEAETAPAALSYGSAAMIRRQCLDNFRMIGKGIKGLDLAQELSELRQWTEAELERTSPQIEERRHEGFVRACHGDMHVTNMIRLDGRIMIFDCIEFNDEFRWIDVMSEIAFLLMDLDMRRHPDLGALFLSAYLEAGGDYGGLDLLRLFRVYRSLVRAKIAFLQTGQNSADEQARKRFSGHVRLARRYIDKQGSAPLVITQGLSGSGKTTITESLIPLTGAIRVRSDVERKRLAGLTPTASSHSGINEDLYGKFHTDRTYERLLTCARFIIKAGLPAVIDAAFLAVEQRQRFLLLARELDIPFKILACQASGEVLRERVTKRCQTGGDASEADHFVLENQFGKLEAFTKEEKDHVVAVDTGQRVNGPALAKALGLPLR